MVNLIENKEAFDAMLVTSQTKLVVVDFFAVW
jgi:hypothetical protein